MKTYLLGMYGYPGSGKTFFATRLCEKNNWFCLSSDRIRRKMYPEPTYTKEESHAVFGFMDYLAREILAKGISVVYDANCNFICDREKLETIARETGALYTLVHITTPEHIALERIDERYERASETDKDIYRPLSKEVYDELKTEMEELLPNERVLTICGTDTFEDQFDTFTSQLQSV